MIQKPLSNIQKELLKLYSTDMKENELTELKTVLSRYFAQKAINEVDDIWDKRKLSNKEMDEWLSE